MEIDTSKLTAQEEAQLLALLEKCDLVACMGNDTKPLPVQPKAVAARPKQQKPKQQKPLVAEQAELKPVARSLLLSMRRRVVPGSGRSISPDVRCAKRNVRTYEVRSRAVNCKGAELS